MNFIHQNYFLVLILILVLVLAVFIIIESKFFKYIQMYWFYKRSLANKISTICLLIGFSLLSIILLDPRGPEQKIKSKVKKDQTILLIDTSTSMFVEDVKPNRMEKAIWMAKHFARRAIGHELAVLIFADMTKKLVPFTNDGDLLEARLDSIKEIRNLNAGSSIELAIAEAVQFFPKTDDVMGNIIVFTDGEETHDGIDFNLPENIHIVLVGVGTKSGGPIPLRNNTQLFFGNKKYKGETVISKLSESFFSKMKAKNKNVLSIIPKSYDVPTDQILDFLKNNKSKEEERDNIIRPVDIERWLIPAALFISLGFIFRYFNPFVLSVLILSLNLYAEEIKFSEKSLQGLQLLKQNKLDATQKIRLADQLIADGAVDMARSLYQEELSTKEAREKNPESAFNWATMELQQKNFTKGLDLYKEQLANASTNKNINENELKKKIDENLKKVFSAQNQQKNKNQKDDKKENQGQDQDKKDQGNQDDKKNDQDSKGNKSKDRKKGSDDKQDQDKNPFDTKNQDKEENKDKGEKEKDDKQNGDKKEDKQKDQDGDPDENKKTEKKKVSPLLEQLKSDDRKLQMKLLDTGTQNKKQRSKRDW